MTTPARPSIDRVIERLFDDVTGDALADEVRAWLAGSPRFRAFADAHRDKIRKKLRGAGDEESRRDVRAELGVAHALLADRRIGLGFEPYGSQQAGPDFAVTFRDHAAFNLEVTRLRRAPGTAALGPALLAKLRQLPPSTANVVLVAMPDPGATAEDIAAAVRAVRQRADARDEAFLRARRIDRPRAFYERFLRLGGVIAWWEPRDSDAAGASAWVNPSARIAVPPPALRAALRTLAGTAP